MSVRQPCIQKVDIFCNVCGKFETQSNRRGISDSIKSKYLEVYKTPMKNLDKPWVPKSICNTCRLNLTQWNDKKGDVIIEPAVWHEPINHDEDCYFCAWDINGCNKRKKNNITYPEVRSVTPAKKGRIEKFQEEETHSSTIEQMHVDEFQENYDNDSFGNTAEHMFYNQDELDDLVRDLNLPKDKSELLASRLKEKNLLLPGTKITVYRKRDNQFLKYFATAESVVFCIDITGLINTYEINLYEPDDWRLFLDGCLRSLKAVLLHNGNTYAAVPIAHSTVLKESYESLKFLLEKINYNLHKWLVCGDFKMINLLVGLQSGNIKYPCYLCLWDSRDREKHWVKKVWEKRSKWEIGTYNVVYKKLVDVEKILIPPLHIKLGLMKQFVKALNTNSKCFKYIRSQFPHLSDAKVQEGIFVGPDIRKLMQDDNFVTTMSLKEKNAWQSFKAVVQNFLGNKRAPDYQNLVSNMLTNFKKLGCLMSLKLHFLFSHLEKFPENVGAFSEEMGERFHQDFKEHEIHYQGKWNERMIADYCWTLKRSDTSTHHRRKTLTRSFQLKRDRFNKQLEDS